MSNFMTRRFSFREKIFLIILVIVLLVGLYFLLVHYPIVNRQREIDEELEETLFQQIVADTLKSEYDMMQDEKDYIEELEANGEDPTYMPKYNNFADLSLMIEKIFADAQTKFEDESEIDHYLDPSPVSIDDETGRATRTLRITFDSKSYDEAKYIIDRLAHTEWRSLMTDVTVNAKGGDNVQNGTVSVSITVVFYERDAQ